MSLFFKARLITIERDAADDDAMWKVNSVKENELLVAIDKAMVPRLISACDERGISVEIDQLEKLLISSGNGATIKTWIEEARVAVVEE
jgi:hypothetical protein